MKRLVSFSLAIFSCLCLLVATERQAHAYIDPGQGMIALQSAAATLATAGYFMRRRFMALFGKKTPTPASLPVAVKSDSRKPA